MDLLYTLAIVWIADQLLSGLSMDNRIRGRKLQRMRKRILCASPVCAMCGTAPATELDHIVALCNGGTNDDCNLQGLCSACHAVKTSDDTGRRVKVTIGLDGWPTGAGRKSVADAPETVRQHFLLR